MSVVLPTSYTTIIWIRIENQGLSWFLLYCVSHMWYDLYKIKYIK